MRVSNGLMTAQELEDNRIAREEVRFRSTLGVFKATNGLRPGEFTVIVGQQGNGKSSLCKTISMSCALNATKCYHLLSEEKSSVYKSSIYNAFNKAANGKNVDNFLDKLYFESMLDWEDSEMNLAYFYSYLEEMINEIQPEMIIFDNFTTSFIGSLPINKQGDVVQALRKMAQVYEIAIIGVFHTAKGTDIYKKVISGEDVRGNASSTNGGAYNYILSTYFRVDPPRAFLSIDKARYHPEANKTFWELVYDKELQIFIGDKKVSYDHVQRTIDEASGKNKTNSNGDKKWTR
jgi:archaellum biogenesis ATPase FlaH